MLAGFKDSEDGLFPEVEAAYPSAFLLAGPSSLIGGAVPRKGEPAFHWQGGRSPPTRMDVSIVRDCGRKWREAMSQFQGCSLWGS